ncbi:MAG: hypothetical protein IJJ33_07865 [Victivallales bacterium]|nr:hypothetical protein [Victivallales bacterium]
MMNKLLRLLLAVLVSFQLVASADTLSDYLKSFMSEASETQSDLKPGKGSGSSDKSGKENGTSDKSGKENGSSDKSGKAADSGAQGNSLLDLGKNIAISQASEQLSKYIGEDNAKKVGEYAQKIANGEMSVDQALADGLKDLVNDKLPTGTADAVNKFINSVADKSGDAGSLGEQLVDLGKNIAISQVADQLGKYIGEENAKKVGEYAEKIANGEMTVDQALADGLQQLVNDKLPPNTAEAVNQFITSIAEGEGLGDITGSLGDMAQAAAQDGVASLLDKTNLSDEQKQDVMNSVNNLLEGDWEAAWDSAKGGASSFVSGIIEDKFGKEAGDKAKGIMDGILNGDTDNLLNSIVDLGTTIGTSELEKKIGEQLDKLGQKFPVLGELFNAIGLDGGGVVGALTNCWNALKDGTFTEKMTQLMGQLTETLNNLAEKLKNFVQNFLSNLVNTVIKGVTDFWDDLLDSVVGTVKADLGGFVNSINQMRGQLSGASGYFLGNDGGDSPTLINMKNNLKNTKQKNVFKAKGSN